MKKRSTKKAAKLGELMPGRAFQAARLIDYAPEAIVSRTFYRGERGNLTLFAFAKGQELAEHSAPYDAHVYVVEGAARVTVGKSKITVKEGKIVRLPANVPHAVRAPQAFKMLLIMIRG